jgi:hypothetical protein
MSAYLSSYRPQVVFVLQLLRQFTTLVVRSDHVQQYCSQYRNLAMTTTTTTTTTTVPHATTCILHLIIQGTTTDHIKNAVLVPTTIQGTEQWLFGMPLTRTVCWYDPFSTITSSVIKWSPLTTATTLMKTTPASTIATSS